jgi:two-component SAPR family response regulator
VGLVRLAKQHYEHLARKSCEQGRLRDTLAFLQNASTVDPLDLRIRSMLSALFAAMGNRAEAVKQHLVIASCLSEKGWMTEAAAVLDRALRLDPDNLEVQKALMELRNNTPVRAVDPRP